MIKSSIESAPSIAHCTPNVVQPLPGISYTPDCALLYCRTSTNNLHRLQLDPFVMVPMHCEVPILFIPMAGRIFFFFDSLMSLFPLGEGVPSLVPMCPYAPPRCGDADSNLCTPNVVHSTFLYSVDHAWAGNSTSACLLGDLGMAEGRSRECWQFSQQGAV